MTPIPESEWVWCGYAGHFMCADKCRCHLHTRVGDYRISTVGEYLPDQDMEMREIGAGRYGETFVFEVEGNGVHGEGDVKHFCEMDSQAYSKEQVENGDIERGHMAMCYKYANLVEV